MSSVLELNCWILGHDPRRVFSVEVPSSKTVSHLKDAIKDKKKHTFAGIDADLLDLWKVDIDLTTNSDLLNSIKEEGNIHDAIELKPWSRLSKLFAGGDDDEHLHIIVQCPALPDIDKAKLDHERLFSEEDGDIITEIVT